jgi:GNAT superfamily N-acetyltransferase
MVEARDIAARSIRFSISKDGVEIAHAFLYLLKNDTHEEPYGFFADINVDESHRKEGIGSELVAAVIARAKAEKCYKLIATSRDDGTRTMVHEWYKRLGFRDYGKEFRMDL